MPGARARRFVRWATVYGPGSWWPGSFTQSAQRFRRDRREDCSCFASRRAGLLHATLVYANRNSPSGTLLHFPRFRLRPIRYIPPESRRTMSARGRLLANGTSAAHRSFREPAVLQQPIVQHQRARHREIEGEPTRDAHHVTAVLRAWPATGPIVPGPARRRHSPDGGTRAGRLRRPATPHPPARSPAAGSGTPGREIATAARAPAYRRCPPAVRPARPIRHPR